MAENKTRGLTLIIEYKSAWYWHLAAWLNLLMAIFIAGDVFFSNKTEQALIVAAVACGSLTFFGVSLMYICATYSIALSDGEIACTIPLISKKRYPLNGVKDVGLNGPYLTLDYGRRPKIVMFLLNSNRQELFNELSDRVHGLPSGTFAAFRKTHASNGSNK